jgi:hypothetical protein
VTSISLSVITPTPDRTATQRSASRVGAASVSRFINGAHAVMTTQIRSSTLRLFCSISLVQHEKMFFGIIARNVEHVGANARHSEVILKM